MGYSLLTDFEKEIINSLAEYDMNVALAAKETHFHRNTYIYHIDKIKRKTGFDPKCFKDLVKLKAMAAGKEYCVSDVIKKYVERARKGQYGEDFKVQRFVALDVEHFYNLLEKLRKIELK